MKFYHNPKVTTYFKNLFCAIMLIISLLAITAPVLSDDHIPVILVASGR